jgi:glycosyltransferase involved in cell wall biosynthesis
MKVSVVIPVYNGARYLRETLDSVFAQTLPAHEVIVVDDGSSDESPDILRAFGDRLRVFRQENQGVAAARNAGLVRVTGEAIAFLDQDDLWPPDRNRLMAEALAANPDVDVVAGLVDLRDETTTRRTVSLEPGIASREMLVGSLLIRPRVFARLGPFSTGVGYADDTDFLVRRSEDGTPTLHLKSVTLIYRIHDRNTSADESVSRTHMLAVFREALRRRRQEAS